MLWVDHQCYFGADRRTARAGMRMRERRHEDYAGRAPCMSTALRQLRIRVIDARGKAGVSAFVDRTNAVARLASLNSEHEAAQILLSLAATIARARDQDIRESMYAHIDRAQAALKGNH